MNIDWSAFSWEAFATLVTGVAAVVGATIVGLRQVGIQKRQADIQEKQVEIARLEVAASLFDRRMEVYSSVAMVAGSIMSGTDPTVAMRIDMLKAMDRSYFLFKEEAVKKIARLHSLFLRYEAIHDRCDTKHWCIFDRDRDIGLAEVKLRMRREIDDNFTTFMASQTRIAEI